MRVLFVGDVVGKPGRQAVQALVPKLRTAHRAEIAGPGQRVVITAGVPFGTPGSTNILRIAWVER